MQIMEAKVDNTLQDPYKSSDYNMPESRLQCFILNLKWFLL